MRRCFLFAMAVGQVFLGGCERQQVASDSPVGLAAGVAQKIGNDLGAIRAEVEGLAEKIVALHQEKDFWVGQARREDYSMAPNGAFFKHVKDEGAALWISGAVPITEAVKEIAYLTEPLDEVFKAIHERHPAVAQSYYNDRNSLNRIYPWFDAIAQYPPKMDIPSFNFYFLADEKHNPGRKGVWVGEPYVDPAGRGWMVSAIAPVYVEGELVGVPGLDVTLENLLAHYFEGVSEPLLVMSESGVVVMATEEVINLLGLPPLDTHKYLETVKQDTFRLDDYNLFNSQNREIRSAMRALRDAPEEMQTLDLHDASYGLEVASVDDMNWMVVHLRKLE